MGVPDLGEGRQTPEQAEGGVGGQGGGGTVRRDVEDIGLIAGTEGSLCLGCDCLRVLPGVGHSQRRKLLRGFDGFGVNRPATNHETLVRIGPDIFEGTGDSRLEVAGAWAADLDFEGGREHQTSRSGGDRSGKRPECVYGVASEQCG